MARVRVKKSDGAIEELIYPDGLPEDQAALIEYATQRFNNKFGKPDVGTVVSGSDARIKSAYKKFKKILAKAVTLSAAVAGRASGVSRTVDPVKYDLQVLCYELNEIIGISSRVGSRRSSKRLAGARRTIMLGGSAPSSRDSKHEDDDIPKLDIGKFICPRVSVTLNTSPLYTRIVAYYKTLPGRSRPITLEGLFAEIKSLKADAASVKGRLGKALWRSMYVAKVVAFEARVGALKKSIKSKGIYIDGDDGVKRQAELAYLAFFEIVRSVVQKASSGSVTVVRAKVPVTPTPTVATPAIVLAAPRVVPSPSVRIDAAVEKEATAIANQDANDYCRALTRIERRKGTGTLADQLVGRGTKGSIASECQRELNARALSGSEGAATFSSSAITCGLIIGLVGGPLSIVIGIAAAVIVGTGVRAWRRYKKKKAIIEESETRLTEAEASLSELTEHWELFRQAVQRVGQYMGSRDRGNFLPDADVTKLESIFRDVGKSSTESENKKTLEDMWEALRGKVRSAPSSSADDTTMTLLEAMNRLAGKHIRDIVTCWKTFLYAAKIYPRLGVTVEESEASYQGIVEDLGEGPSSGHSGSSSELEGGGVPDGRDAVAGRFSAPSFMVPAGGSGVTLAGERSRLLGSAGTRSAPTDESDSELELDTPPVSPR